MGKKSKVDNGGVDPQTAIVWTDDDGIIHVRNSERGTLAKCPQRWWWAWREGLRPKETPKALWFGSAVHDALALYYRPGYKRAKLSAVLEAFTAYADMEGEYIRTNVGDLDEDKWIEAKDLGVGMLRGYVEEYGKDKDWDVIGTEQSFDLEVPFFSKLDPADRQEAWETWVRAGFHWQKHWGLDYFILNGTFDGVYRDKRDKKTKLMEHKTAGTVWMPMVMDNQTGTYWLVADAVGKRQGWLGKKESIHYITYNFLRKALPDERPRDAAGYVTNKPLKQHFLDALPEKAIPTLKKEQTLVNLQDIAEGLDIVVLGDRSKRQPPPLFVRTPIRMGPQNRLSQLARLQADVRYMSTIVSGQAEIRKQAGRDTCPMCPFKDMCEVHDSGGNWVSVRDMLYRGTDPYADHRKSAEGS